MIDYTHYIGMPYDRGSFNCWDFFRRIQLEAFGRDLPPMPIDVVTLRDIQQCLGSNAARHDWRKVKQPHHGDAVLLHRARDPSHVGCWLDIDGGGVMHNLDQTGVVFQDLLALKLGRWNVAGFYQYAPCHA